MIGQMGNCSGRVGSCHTGWLKKNATPTINNFKKTRDKNEKVVCIKINAYNFFLSKMTTKFINFDEGVLIL